jgi:tRNA (guanine37-N1)-methyltransferase
LQKKENNKIENLIFVSGRYEGIDSRVEEIFPGKRISIGDFVLTGGELPAMILIDSISRQIFGVLGNEKSLEEERISSGKFFTKPAILK